MQQEGLTAEQGEELQNDPDRLAVALNRQRRDVRHIFVEHLPTLLQLLLVRSYDAFYVYATDLARHIYEARVAGIKRGDTELDELLDRLVSRHIYDLARAGQKKQLYTELRERLGLPWLQVGHEQNRELIVAEMRHAYTHNSGRISSRFVREVGVQLQLTIADIGRPVPLDPNLVLEDIQLLHSIVKRTDEVANSKYHLEAAPISPEPATTGTVYDQGIAEVNADAVVDELDKVVPSPDSAPTHPPSSKE